MSDILSGADFVKAIANGEIYSKATVMGLVKPAETEGCILFCSKSDASTWTEVPASLIEAGEQMGMTTVGGNSFPLSRLQLSATSASESQILSDILSQPVQFLQGGGSIGGIVTGDQLMQIGGGIGGISTGTMADSGFMVIGSDIAMLAFGGGDVVGNGWAIILNQGGGDGVGNGYIIIHRPSVRENQDQ